MATTFQSKTEPQSLVGLPPNTTLLEFGRWLKTDTPDVQAHLQWVQSLGAEVGIQHVATMEAALELAETSSDAASYLTDPVGWIERFVEFPKGKRLMPYQGDALTTLAEEHRLALRSCHGAGKSSLAALAVLHFALTRDAAGIPWKCPTTASAWRQLVHFLWPEIHIWSRRLRWDELGRPPFNAFELQTLRLKLAYGEAWGQASNDPAATEGAHATHLMFVFDEARSIPPPIWDSAEGAFSGAGPDTEAEAWALALSVPGAPVGRFFDIHARKKGYLDWKVRHVKIEEAVDCGQVSQTWVDQKKLQWGERSAIFQQRVLGNFATTESNTVIPLEWIELAVERYHDYAMRGVDLGPILGAGLDIARDGDDESVVAMSTRDCVLPLERPQGRTTGVLVAQAKVALSVYPGRPHVLVDADGIGAGYFDAMREGIDWADRVHPFRAAGKAIGRDVTNTLEFGNRRAEAWWALRDELNPHRPDFTPTLAIPDDSMLIGDLSAPTYREGAGGRIFIEDKDDIRKKLGRSTDAGDACVQSREAVKRGARATVTAAQHKARVGTQSGDLRRGEDAAGPDQGTWSPLRVQW